MAEVKAERIRDLSRQGTEQIGRETAIGDVRALEFLQDTDDELTRSSLKRGREFVRPEDVADARHVDPLDRLIQEEEAALASQRERILRNLGQDGTSQNGTVNGSVNGSVNGTAHGIETPQIEGVTINLNGRSVNGSALTQEPQSREAELDDGYDSGDLEFDVSDHRLKKVLQRGKSPSEKRELKRMLQGEG